MKRGLLRILTIFACVLALVNFICLNDLLAADVINIKLATGAEKWLSIGKGFGKFAELVNERSQGRVKIEIYYSGALGNEATAIRNMSAKTVEMSTSSDGSLGSYSDALYFMNLPYIFSGTEGLRKVVNQQWIRDYVNSILAKQNIRHLIFFDNGGPRHFETNKKKVKVPDDVKGMKFGSIPTKVNIDTLAAFGALPTPINWGEVYMALEQKTIDGYVLMYTWMYSTKHYEVIKYVCENGYVLGCHNGYMRLDFWDKLPKDIQDLITKCARDAEAWEAKVDADYTKEAREAIIKHGVEIYTPTREEMNLWRAAVVPKIWDMYKDKVSPELIQKIQDFQK